MINELIEQIGGRERLEEIVYAMGAEPCDADPILESVTHGDIGKMARALLAVLDAQEKPLGYVDQRVIDSEDGNGGMWVKRQSRQENFYSVPVYTAPQAASVPDGWKLVPLEPHWSMIDAAIKHHEGQAFLPVSLYKAILAAAPAPGGEK